MKPTSLLLSASIVLNVVLLTLVGPRAGLPWRDLVTGRDSQSGSAVDPDRGRQTPTAAAKGAVSATKKVTAPLWSAAGPDDLDTLVARLRAAGVSAREIHTIVMTLLSSSFEKQRRALRGDTAESPYWQSRLRTRDPATEAKSMALFAEQEALNRKYLLDPELFAANEEIVSMARRMYGPFSTEMLRKLLSLELEFQQKSLETVGAQRTTQPGVPRYGTPDGPWAALREEKIAAARALLSPAEFEQYELRTSETAGRLRSRLGAFQASEAEFKALFAIEKSFANQGTALSGPQTKALEQAKFAQITAAVGPQRAEEYRLAAAPQNRELGQLLVRLDLPLSTISTVNSVREQAMEQAHTIKTNAKLTASARAAQLAAVAQAAAAKLSTTLGPRGYEAYSQSAGSWVDSLAAPPKPDAP